MKRFYLVILSIFSYITVWGQNIKPYFIGSSTLKDPYGICAHFTFSGAQWDKSTMPEQSRLMKDLGCNIVRCDVLDDAVNQDNNASLDQVLTTLGKNKLDFLGIAYDFRLSSKQWNQSDSHFDQFLNTIQKGYISKLHYLEFHNEVNFSKLPGLGQHYTDDLKQLYALKKKNKNFRVVFSGIADTRLDFLDSTMQNNAYRYFDIMNFHTYRIPEDIPSLMKVIYDNMTKYHWSKPVWLTECGMHTARDTSNNTNRDFFTKVVPDALKKIGYAMKGLKIGVINDVAKSYCVLNEEEVRDYITNLGAIPIYVTFQQLNSLNPKNIPVLVATSGESFYSEYFPAILNYVRNGGTIILSYGTPFYYDASNGNKGVGKNYTQQLHIGQLYWWEDAAKKLKAPETPNKEYGNPKFEVQYSWLFNQKTGNTARYLTDKNLRGNDQMIPITYAGNDAYTGVVAALYKLNSDLKGNIIIQTRLGTGGIVDKEDEQARRVARIHLIAFAYGVDKVFWYKFRSNEQNLYYSEDNFGMVHKDLSPKPAYYAYKTLIKMCPNGSTRPVLQIKDGIYKAGWTKPDGIHVFALWCKQGYTYLNIDQKGGQEFYNYMGKKLDLLNGKLKVSTGVVFSVTK